MQILDVFFDNALYLIEDLDYVRCVKTLQMFVEFF